MAASLVSFHPKQPYATCHDRLDLSEPAVPTVVPPDTKLAEELNFAMTDEIAMLKKENYKAHMCVRINLYTLG